MRVFTESVQFKADQKLLDFIQERIMKLEQFYDQIINAKVVLKLENSGRIREKIVEVIINVPGDQLFSKSVDKTFEAATDHAAQALERQIKKFKSKNTHY